MRLEQARITSLQATFVQNKQSAMLIEPVEATGEFVVNVVSFALAEKMNQSSAEYHAEVSEFDACEVPQAPSVRVR